MWACNVCTLDNKVGSLACEVCATSKPITANEQAATAINGTVSNQPTSAQKQKRPRISSASSVGAWTCASCTFENMGTALRCVMCQQCPSLTVPMRTNQFIPQAQHSQSQLSTDVRATDEKHSAALFHQINITCQDLKEPFVDDSFRPEPSSLGDIFRAETRTQNRHALTLQQLAWCRPAQLNTADGRALRWAVMRQPLPTDIRQGSLGNCWLICALAGLTERPELLDRIVLTKQYSHTGLYAFRFCVYGEWRTVLVDDLLPCTVTHHTLVFSSAKRNQLWVPLMEKALAKVYGSYERLVAGHTSEGLALLTGAPCDTLKLRHERDDFDADLIWAKLVSAREARFLMACSCAAGRDQRYSDEDCEKVGLLSKHAYSLMDVQTLHTADNEHVRLVRVRNPWGTFSWKGDWGPESGLWTKTLHMLLRNPEGHHTDKGTFWMPFDAFCEYFDSVDMCKVRDNWHETRLRLAMHPDSTKLNTLSITINETIEVDFALYQDAFRARSTGTLTELDLLLLVVDMVDDKCHVLSSYSERRIAPFVTCSAVLKAGQYSVLGVAFNHYGQRAAIDCVLSVHAAKPFTHIQQHPSCTLLADAITLLVMATGQRHATKQQGINVWSSSRDWSGLCVLVQNVFEDACALVQVDCTQSVNVVSTRQALCTHDIVPPMHTQIVMMLSQLENSAGYQLQHQITYSRTHKHHVPESNAAHQPAISASLAALHLPRPIIHA